MYVYLNILYNKHSYLICRIPHGIKDGSDSRYYTAHYIFSNVSFEEAVKIRRQSRVDRIKYEHYFQ